MELRNEEQNQEVFLKSMSEETMKALFCRQETFPIYIQPQTCCKPLTSGLGTLTCTEDIRRIKAKGGDFDLGTPSTKRT